MSSRPRLLITGFGPFPGVSTNPTEDLVRQLPDHLNPDLLGIHFKTYIFNTEWQKVHDDLNYLFRTIKPDICLHFGYQENASGFRLETHAHNLTEPKMDACGCFPQDNIILQRCNTVLKSDLPLNQVFAHLNQENIPVELSGDAGRYLCNYLYFLSLYRMSQAAGRAASCFIHIPAPAQQILDGSGHCDHSHKVSPDQLIAGTIEIIKNLLFHYHAAIMR